MYILLYENYYRYLMELLNFLHSNFLNELLIKMFIYTPFWFNQECKKSSSAVRKISYMFLWITEILNSNCILTERNIRRYTRRLWVPLIYFFSFSCSGKKNQVESEVGRKWRRVFYEVLSAYTAIIVILREAKLN